MKHRLFPSRTYVHNHRRRRRYSLLLWLAALMLPVAAYLYWQSGVPAAMAPAQPPEPVVTAHPGDVLGIDSVQSFTPIEAETLAKQNYGTTTPPVTTGITKVTFHYRSQLPSGQLITVYGRAYLPASPTRDLPVFAFAPGTTGIGDQCAPSLENPQVANWANYDSHMVMYASQGFAAVTTDYEGMRDPNRIHHYMVGELEGRAVLDSIRALRHLPQAQGRLDAGATFLGGYSQGGHAAYWADKIAAQYAPDVKPTGVVGFGPVMSVGQTLADVTHGANIDWFGPYVLYSYEDYYDTTFPVDQILTPRFAATLHTDVPAHCIDTDLSFWGHVPAAVYTPEFLQALSTNQLGVQYPDLQRDLDANAVGAVSTSSAKLINAGQFDNVVLPSQQQAEARVLCQSSKGPVNLKIYPGATHYDTMVKSLNDTLAWMRTLVAGKPVPSSCPPPSS